MGSFGNYILKPAGRSVAGADARQRVILAWRLAHASRVVRQHQEKPEMRISANLSLSQLARDNRANNHLHISRISITLLRRVRGSEDEND